MTEHERAVGRGPLRIALLHDSEVVVLRLTRMLGRHADRVTLVPSVEEDGGAAPGRVDIALADLCLDLPDAVDDLPHLRHACGANRLVVWCRTVSPVMVEAAFTSGASGYLSTELSAEELVDALEDVAVGDCFVTKLPTRPAEATTPWACPEPHLAGGVHSARERIPRVHDKH